MKKNVNFYQEDELKKEQKTTDEELLKEDDFEEDFSRLLGGPGTSYSWAQFYQVRREELARGERMCPQASLIALNLLTSTLLKLPWKSNRTNSETYKDFLQNCWLLIAENIADYDESVSAFPTYMSKWFSGLARETRDDGLTDYQRKKGYRVFSEDAMIAKNDPEGNGDSHFEHIDENSSIEDILEKKNQKRLNDLLHQMMVGGEKKELEFDEKNLKERRFNYANITCAALFLGGLDTMSEDEIDFIVSAYA